MADAKSILIKIPPPEISLAGTIDQFTYQWIGPLRTPARLCSSGEHEIISYSLIIKKPYFFGIFKKKIELSLGLLNLHNISQHNELVSEDVKKFFND